MHIRALKGFWSLVNDLGQCWVCSIGYGMHIRASKGFWSLVNVLGKCWGVLMGMEFISELRKAFGH